MDKISKRYTYIAWFFTFNAAWVLLNTFVFRKLLFSQVMTQSGTLADHPRYGQAVMMIYSTVGYVIEISWYILLALLAWTARNEYISRKSFTTGPETSEATDG
jgi:hypothetical protein